MTKETIIQQVSEITNISTEQIKGASRFREIADARKLSMLLIKENFEGATLSEIGRFFKKDHASVLHNIKVSRHLLLTDNGFKRKYERCKIAVNNFLNYQFNNIPQH